MPIEDNKKITLEQLHEILIGVKTSNEEIKTSNDEIKKQNNEIKKEVTKIRIDLEKQIREIKEENNELKIEVTNLKEKLQNIERKAKKYNLVVYGLEENETEIEDIQNFLSTINSKCEVDCRFEDIRDIYRIGKLENDQKIRPLIVELINYKQLTTIFENAHKLKGSSIVISRDYTPEEYKDRKILHKHLILARKNNLNASIKKSRLHIKDKVFSAVDLNSVSEENFVKEILSFIKKDTEGKGNEYKRITRQNSQNTPNKK